MTWGLVGFELGVVWSDSPLEVSAVASLFGGGRPCWSAVWLVRWCIGEQTFCLTAVTWLIGAHHRLSSPAGSW